MSLETLHPYFLGPYGENADLFEDLLTDFVRDHVYWRRNFHPESSPPIPTSAPYRDDFIDFVARMRRELFSLSADLKRSVPWFSPRYVGHMASDLLLPGLIANLVTTLYNPNNVSEEAAPVTVDKEIEVGFQLAEMFGFETDAGGDVRAWGHLTSGGTVANYEGLRNLSAVRYYPLALADAVGALDLGLGDPGPLDHPLPEYSDWELFNLSLEEVFELRRAYLDAARQSGPDVFRALHHAVDRNRLETKGTVQFFRDHSDLAPPAVLVPRTAHYSWPKAMKVLELGTANLVRVEVDGDMRMETADLRRQLDRLADRRKPVLAAVGILGTTEFGTVDPIADLVEERERRRENGMFVPIHVDAAWGGYLTSMFRRPDGELVDRSELRDGFEYFPSETVYRSFAALSEVDSITVDPHKLGYIPYPAGAYVARDARMINFIGERAPYAFSGEDDEQTDLRERLRNLGQYILEGSKPGSAAASVHVTHRVLPLHTDAFGELLKETVRASEYFFDRVEDLARRLEDRVRLEVPFEPDCNVVCLAVNPAENSSAPQMNEFVGALYDNLRIDLDEPIQSHTYFASSTALEVREMSPAQLEVLTEDLGLDPETLETGSTPPGGRAEHILLLRNTLMNPWLRFEEEGRNYIDGYLETLEERIRDELRGLSAGDSP